MTEWAFASGALVFAALVALIWRQTMSLVKLAGVSTRARDRERHDMHQLIERLLEKRDTTDGIELARLHKIERLEQARLDARVEENVNKTPLAVAATNRDEFCTPEEYEE